VRARAVAVFSSDEITFRICLGPVADRGHHGVRPVATLTTTIAQSWDVAVDAHGAFGLILVACGLTTLVTTTGTTYRLMGVWSAFPTLELSLLFPFMATQLAYGKTHLLLSAWSAKTRRVSPWSKKWASAAAPMPHTWSRCVVVRLVDRQRTLAGSARRI
jgi:hypothetical protein